MRDRPERAHGARRVLVLAAAASVGWSAAQLGCNGLIGDPATSPLPGDDPLAKPPLSACEDPGWVMVQRPTLRELDRALHDLLGIASNPSDQLPPDSVGPYANDATTLSRMPVEVIEKLVDLSQSIVDEAFTTGTVRAQYVTCDPSQAGLAACTRTV